MKKLILSLFAIATVFVACDKEAFDTQEPTVLELEEANVSMEAETPLADDLLTLISNLQDAKLPDAEPGLETLSARGSDYLNLTFFTFNNEPYITFLDESNDDLRCIIGAPGVSGVNSIYFDNVNGDGSAIAVEDAQENVVTTVTGDFAAFFADANNSIIKLTATYDIVASEALNAHNRVSVSGADIKLACAADFYTVSSAPFPLNGFLATIDDAAGLTAAFGGSSPNFAGTLMGSVTSTIEDNIKDGN